MKENYTQSGNVLFLILIAVTLFAALSYAVTQSTRGGGNATSEKLALDAAQIQQWHSTLKYNFIKFSLNSGIAQPDIRINNGFGWLPCTTGSDCLWAPEGGNLEYPPSQIERYFSGFGAGLIDNTAGSSGIAGFTSPNWIFSYIGNTPADEALCQAYNDSLGLGPYGASQSTYPGEETACWEHGSSGNYTIYFVFFDG
jgi:hypothetical protein